MSFGFLIRRNLASTGAVNRHVLDFIALLEAGEMSLKILTPGDMLVRRLRRNGVRRAVVDSVEDGNTSGRVGRLNSHGDGRIAADHHEPRRRRSIRCAEPYRHSSLTDSHERFLL